MASYLPPTGNRNRQANKKHSACRRDYRPQSLLEHRMRKGVVNNGAPALQLEWPGASCILQVTPGKLQSMARASQTVRFPKVRGFTRLQPTLYTARSLLRSPLQTDLPLFREMPERVARQWTSEPES